MEFSNTQTVGHGVGSKTPTSEEAGCTNDQTPSLTKEAKEEADILRNDSSSVDSSFHNMVNAAQKAELPQNDTAEAWAAVLEAMTKFDERLTKDWKDDLQNMLIFAGLFSTVVTAFVIESYTWIQEDPTDTSAQVLVQVSHQLSSLTLINGVLTFTAPPAVPPQFTPQPIYVRINTLWFLSLAMSLVAALLAIVVQQWMLVYQSSAYTSVRQAVRLRQLRYHAIRRWGVPWIVATVPILLQVALTLFFAGGWLFLQSLNKTVFTPYATLVAVSLGALGGSLVASSIGCRCPYKSPLSCAASLILEIAPRIAVTTPLDLFWIFILVAYTIFVVLIYTITITVCTVISLLVILFLAPFMVLCAPCMLLSSEPTYSRLIGLLHNLYRHALSPEMRFKILNTIKSFGYSVLDSLRVVRGDLKYASTGPTDYWHACERELVARIGTGNLDSKALSWVLPYLSKHEYPQLKHCLGGLSSPIQLDVVAEWITQNLKLPTTIDLVAKKVPFRDLFGWLGTSHLDQEFISRHLIEIIMHILPDPTWGNEDAAESTSAKATPILLFLRHIAFQRGTKDSLVRDYTMKVIALCESQMGPMSNARRDLATSSYYLLRFPTQALFECYFFLKQAFNTQDSFVALRIAERFCNNNVLLTVDLGRETKDYSHYVIDITLGSCATALGALAQRSEDLDMHNAKDRYLDLVRKLGEFIEREQSGIHSLPLALPASPEDRAIPFAAVNALVSIARSLVTLTQAGYLGQNDDCPSRALVDSLYRLSAGQATLRECGGTLRSAGLTGTQTETAAPAATTGGQPEAPVVQELDNGSGRAYGDGFASARDLEEGKSVSIGNEKDIDDGSG